MKICFVAFTYIAREKKLACLLHKMGHELILVSKAYWDNHGLDYFSRKYHFTDWNILAKIIQNIEKDVDVFHVFTEPSELVSVVADHTNRPVLGEMKDSDFLRNGIKIEKESEAFRKADATIHPTKECMEALNEAYDFNGPTDWYWPLVPKDWYLDSGIGEGAVYQGSMTTTQEVNELLAKGRDFSYRDYTKVFKAFNEAGLPVTCYTRASTRRAIKEHYRELVSFEDYLPYPELIKRFSEFKVGIATWGSQSTPALKSIPNKPFEYMAGGLVPIALKGSVVGDWIEEHGVGYTMIDDVPDLSDIEDRRENLLKVRDDWCLETQVDRVIKIYKELTCQ